MALFERCAIFAACCASVAACNAIAGLGEFQDVACEPCEAGSALPDSSPFPEDVAVPDDVQSAEDGATADATLDAGVEAADVEAGPIVRPDGAVSVDLRWPRWVMPNSADDAGDAGLPNPASYAPITGGPGVFDLVTRLSWGVPQTNAITTIDAANAACAPPTRVPTRIELVSLLDTSRASPPLVSPSFEAMPPSKFWTSSTTADGRSCTVDFGSGTIAPSTSASAVICVLSGDGGAP